MENQDYGYLIKKIYETLQKRSNHLMRAGRPTMTQCYVLKALNNRENGTASLKELEHLFSVSQPTISGVIKRLEGREYVTTFEDSADKRAKNVVITERGRALIGEIIEFNNSTEDLVVHALTEEEKAEFTRLLSKVYDSIKE